MTQRQLKLFGAPRLVVGGSRVALPRRKALALLAYLAATGVPHTRESLAALLWGDSDEQSANAYLRNGLWTLNKTLGPDWLDTEGGTVALNFDALSVDTAAFLGLAGDVMHAEPAERMKLAGHAIELYAGEFMAGFTLPDAPEFTSWQIATAESLQRTMIGVLMIRAEAARAVNDLFAATDAAQRWLTVDPLDERAARLMMQVLAEAGEYTAAVRQFHDLRRRLRESIGAAPEAATAALFEALTARASGPVAVQEHVAAGVAVAPPPDLIPPQPALKATQEMRMAVVDDTAREARLVGRERERATLLGLLSLPDVRLVTIVAPGGMGKSLLARRTIADARSLAAFSDGAYWIPLAPLCSADVILSTIAAALPYPLETGPDIESRLFSTLADKRMLLVIDNFEHVLDGAPLLTELLNAAPGITALVTSRERLNLRNERVFELHGLSVPRSGDNPLDTPSEAVDLFVERAQQATLDFAITPENAADIARICRLVEGMPLALELAASWTPLLTCAEIAREIRSGLDFLTSPTRDVPERHRSLRAVFESSWEQMTPDEQTVLSQLAVFRGGFRLEAAAAVAGASPRVLLSLVNKSLVKRRDDGRFSIHELLRQFSEGMLDPEARLDAVDKHIAYYAGLAAAEGVRMTTHEQRDALDALQAEIDNLRSAWRHAIARRKLDALNQMVEPIMMFYRVRSRFDDLTEMISSAADHLPAETATERALMAKLLVASALLHYRDRHLTIIDALADRALAYLRPLANRPDMGIWLILAAVLKRRPGRVQPEAEELIALGRQNLEQQGNVWGIGYALYELGTLQHMQLRYAEARETYNRALYYFEKTRQPWGIYATLEMLAENMLTVGNYPAARDYFTRQFEPLRQLSMRSEIRRLEVNLALLEQRGVHPHLEKFLDALEQLRASGDRRGTAWANYNIGWLYYLNQDYAEARERFLECLSAFTALGDDEGIIWSNIYLAEVTLQTNLRAAMETYVEGARRALAEVDFPWGVCGLEYTLGNRALQDGELDEARAHYRRAVEVAHGAQSLMQTLRHMTGLADVWAREQRLEDALKIVVYVSEHPTTWEDTLRRAGALRDRLTADLTPEQIARAQAEGRAFTIDTVVALALS